MESLDGQGAWDDCNGVLCKAEGQGMSVRPQLLQGLLCPREFGLHPPGQRVWWWGRWEYGQEGEKRLPPNELETFPGPFQTLTALPSQEGGRTVIAEMVQSIKVSWEDLGNSFPSSP